MLCHSTLHPGTAVSRTVRPNPFLKRRTTSPITSSVELIPEGVSTSPNQQTSATTFATNSGGVTNEVSKPNLTNTTIVGHKPNLTNTTIVGHKPNLTNTTIVGHKPNVDSTTKTGIAPSDAISKTPVSSIELIQIKVNMNEKIPHRDGTEMWLHCINTLFCHDLIEGDAYDSYIINADPFKDYYVNGTQINNVFHGDIDVYNTERKHIAKLVFMNGIVNGFCELYDNYGVLFFRGIVQEGFIYRGEIYNEKGEFQYIGVFNRGNLIGYLKYDSASRLYKEIDCYGNISAIYKINKQFLRNGICYRYNHNEIIDICIYYMESELKIVKTFDQGIMTEKSNSGIVVYKGEYIDSFEQRYARHGNGTQYDHTGIHVVYQGQFWKNMRFGVGSSFKDGNSEPIYNGLWYFNLPDYKIRRLVISLIVIAILIDIICFIRGSYIMGILLLVLFYIIAMVAYSIFRKILFKFPLPIEIEKKRTVRTAIGLALAHPFTTILTLPNNSISDPYRCNFQCLKQLKHLSIGNNSLTNLIELNLMHMDKLESFQMGNDCCNKNPGSNANLRIVPKFCINDCRSLKSINILDRCFVYYEKITLSSMPSLQTISIGSYCFRSVRELIINHFTCLNTIRIGSESFQSTKMLIISNNPVLESIHIQDKCFPNVSELIIQSNEHLISLDIGDSCFIVQKSFSLSSILVISNDQIDLPLLKTVKVGDNSFKDTNSFSLLSISIILYTKNRFE